MGEVCKVPVKPLLVILLLAGCATRPTSIPTQRGDAERLRGSLRGANKSVTETAKASGNIEQEAEKLIQFLKQ